MADQLIVLVGRSGSGKTTIAHELEKLGGYHVVPTYTTRPPRFDGEAGHVFGMLSDYVNANASGSIVAQTHFDGEFYWSTKSQYQDKGKCIYIVDPNGVRDLRKYVKDASIVVIHLVCARNGLYDRLLSRCETIEDVAKIRDRMNHDMEVFRIVPCDYAVDANGPVKEVLKNVLEVIENEKN